MKLTKQQLKRLIKEELQNALQEQEGALTDADRKAIADGRTIGWTPAKLKQWRAEQAAKKAAAKRGSP